MTTAHSTKPTLSFWQIWNMSFGFLGIQFGFGLQMANMSAIYQFLGASADAIPILWLAAPVTGLIVQPIIGYMSDRTWNKLGRRRPYFLVGAILSSLALIAMPNSPSLWVAAGLLWILDASINVSMEPFRAFVGDKLPPQQRKVGFAMQSLLIGGGAVLASALPWMLSNWFGMTGGQPDIKLVGAGGEDLPISLTSVVPATVHVAFYIGAAVFLIAVLYTIITTDEYPPEDMEAFQKMKRESGGPMHFFVELGHGLRNMPGTMRRLAVVQFFTWFGLFCMWIFFIPSTASKVFGGRPMGDDPASGADSAAHTKVVASIKSALLEARGGDQAILDGTEPENLPVRDYFEKVNAAVASEEGSPDGVSQLERRNPIYSTTAAILAAGGTADEQAAVMQARLAESEQYRKGVEWGGLCFSVYNLVAFGFAFALLGLVRVFSARNIHMVCLAAGGLGLGSAAFVGTQYMLIPSMVLVGIAWASILSMPYAMLSNVIPGAKMGFYMGVFNFFIVLPQIIASLGLGLVVRHFLGGDGINAIILGGASFLLAAVSCLLVGSDSETGAATADEAAA
jgi:maltose/moltooligosaccharide transporter